jgi:hypothetical protein
VRKVTVQLQDGGTEREEERKVTGQRNIREIVRKVTVQPQDGGTEREEERKVKVQPQDRGRGREKVKDGYSSTLGQRNRKKRIEAV